MNLRPEDVKSWFVDETEPVKKKLKDIFIRPHDGKSLETLYLKLKEKLKTYPPDESFFSIPRMDIHTNTFWVRSENNRILVRAKYVVWAKTAVIDKFYLSEEKPKDLDL